MRNRKVYKILALGLILVSVFSCKAPKLAIREANTVLPSSFGNSDDSTSVVDINWKAFYSDEYLVALIDTALKNNQELNIALQEIEISKNEVQARKGEYLPFVNLGAGTGVEKVGEYTRDGAVEKQLDVKEGRKFPEPLGDFYLGAYASWELDVWRKLRNAKDASLNKFLASVEARNYLVTNLVAEIAESYYELLALENLLDIIEKNVAIQTNAFQVVKQQKNAGKVTQLAVNRFEAQLLNTQNLQYDIKQKIVEVENRINFMTAGYPSQIKRIPISLMDVSIDSIQLGIPSQLLLNRPDIRQAEFELTASKLDVKSARANFLPSFGIKSGIGFQSFNPTFLVNPQSILFNLAGDLMAPLINKNGIKATYNSASARQIQAVYKYEQTLLNAYLDVLNQSNKLDNYNKSFETKNKEVETLTQSIDIANSLFNSARADYTEVLLTQREALEARLDLLEIKLKQLKAKVNIYRALGGGWK